MQLDKTWVGPIYGMYLNSMTEGPKTPCFFFTSGYLQDSPLIGSSKLEMFINIQVLSTFLFFNVFFLINFYLGVPVPRTWALFFTLHLPFLGWVSFKGLYLSWCLYPAFWRASWYLGATLRNICIYIYSLPQNFLFLFTFHQFYLSKAKHLMFLLQKFLKGRKNIHKKGEISKI